jgi:hypothetical protein
MSNRARVRAIFLTATALALLFPPGSTRADDKDQEIQELRSLVETLGNRLEKLEKANGQVVGLAPTPRESRLGPGTLPDGSNGTFSDF